MSTTSSYYVVAPIDGLRLDFDYRMFSAEVYGCEPNYTPSPEACPEFREAYTIFGSFTFDQYSQVAAVSKIDEQSLRLVRTATKSRLKDYTCISFQLDLDRRDADISNVSETNEALFRYVIDKGERLLDVWRLCVFKPGEEFSIGSFGGIGNGVQCFWIGHEDIDPIFIARKTSRFQLVQEPVTVRLSEFGPIYADMTFRGLSVAAFYYPHNKHDILDRIFEALLAFRQSRNMETPEARFKQLAVIAEDLAKKEKREQWKGNELRERIAKIAVHGWHLYERHNMSLLPLKLAPEQYRLMWQRYETIGWRYDEDAVAIITELWSKVRNPLSHTLSTFALLKRDADQDLRNLERVIVMMINGLHAAYETEDLFEESPYDYLLRDD